VVRADYANIMYMRLAREAMAIWRSDPAYKPFYHKTGLIWIDGKGFMQNVIKNYAQLEAREKVRVRGGNNQLVSYIDYDYYIIITNIIGIKVQIILY
jgi:hypothetical protein